MIKDCQSSFSEQLFSDQLDQHKSRSSPGKNQQILIQLILMPCDLWIFCLADLCVMFVTCVTIAARFAHCCHSVNVTHSVSWILPDRLMNIDSDIRNTLSCWLLQRQCWLSDQVSAWWGPSCMESASPGKPINCEFTSEKFNIDYWPSRQLATSRSNCKALKVCAHCTALKLSEIMLLYFPDRMFSFHCLWFLLLLQAADKKSPRTCT